MFGPWGEMHSSTYSKSAKDYHWLLNALLDYVPPTRSIKVHAGAIMVWHNIEYGTAYNFNNLMPAPALGSNAQRFCVFNDSYALGSHDFTDQFSLSEGIEMIGGTFDRNAALTCIRNQNNFYGGETNTIGAFNDPSNIYPFFPSAPYEAAYSRTSHLNTDWAPGANRYWCDFVYTEENITKPFTQPHDGVTRKAIFDPVYNNRNGLVYMRDRLGYRLVLREAHLAEEIDAKTGTLEFKGKIQNVGFGNIINKKLVFVILQPKGGAKCYSYPTSIDARDWRTSDDDNGREDNKAAYRDINFTIAMKDFTEMPLLDAPWGTVQQGNSTAAEIKPGEYFVYLKINDPKEKSSNKRCIQFANYDIWNATIGANLIGIVNLK